MNEPARRLTVEQYLALEAAGDVRYEYLDGQVFAMAGGSPEHAAIAANVIGHLRGVLRDRPCHIFTSDAKVEIEATGLFTYPDVTVVCGDVQRSAKSKDTIINPLLLVEVTSESTEDGDRGGKFAHYRRIPTLREYLVIAQTERFIEHHVRRDDGAWVLTDVRNDATIALASVGGDLPLDEVYLKVALA
jgi:Uma2 family endonuclease